MLKNDGMRLLSGTASCEVPWLSLSDDAELQSKLYEFTKQAVLTVRVLGRHLRALGKPQEAAILLESNGGTVTVVVRVLVPVKPFPEGVLSGALSPRTRRHSAVARSTPEGGGRPDRERRPGPMVRVQRLDLSGTRPDRVRRGRGAAVPGSARPGQAAASVELSARTRFDSARPARREDRVQYCRRHAGKPGGVGVRNQRSALAADRPDHLPRPLRLSAVERRRRLRQSRRYAARRRVDRGERRPAVQCAGDAESRRAELTAPKPVSPPCARPSRPTPKKTLVPAAPLSSSVPIAVLAGAKPAPPPAHVAARLCRNARAACP